MQQIGLHASGQGAAEKFTALVERFAVLAAEEGMRVLPYRTTQIEWFPKLTAEHQEKVLRDFGAYVTVCDESASEGKSLKDDRHLLWRMFRHLGVRPTAELLSTFTDDDIIEIYNTEFVQIFRSLRFFENCSYSLDELICRPFWDLYARAPRVAEDLVHAATGSFGGNGIPLVPLDPIGAHAVEEISSEGRFRMVVEYRHLSPLYDSTGGVPAVVTAARCLNCERPNEGLRARGTERRS